MFKPFHVVLIAGWFAVLVAGFVARVAFGVPISAFDSMVLLALGCIPAVVLLAVFRGAPPPSVAQVLYDAEQAPDAGVTTAKPADAADANAARR